MLINANTTQPNPTNSLASVLLCLVCICLVCLPQMAGWAQDITHFCTNCGAKVAFRPHDGQTQVMRPMAASEYVSKYQPVAEPAPAYKPAG